MSYFYLQTEAVSCQHKWVKARLKGESAIAWFLHVRLSARGIIKFCLLCLDGNRLPLLPLKRLKVSALTPPSTNSSGNISDGRSGPIWRMEKEHLHLPASVPLAGFGHATDSMASAVLRNQPYTCLPDHWDKKWRLCTFCLFFVSHTRDKKWKMKDKFCLFQLSLLMSVLTVQVFHCC